MTLIPTTKAPNRSQPAPAHAFGMLYDEVIPYAGATSFAIMWGIVLGFVLLRLQEAFPE